MKVFPINYDVVPDVENHSQNRGEIAATGLGVYASLNSVSFKNSPRRERTKLTDR